jgi:hypothetical protein
MTEADLSEVSDMAAWREDVRALPCPPAVPGPRVRRRTAAFSYDGKRVSCAR